MSESRVFEVEILKWEKYNPGGKKLPWIRIEGSLIHSAKWELLSASGRLLWLSLLCLKSTVGPSNVRFTPKNGSRLAKCKPGRLPAVLRELEQTEWIRVVKSPLARALTDVRTIRNDTRRTNETDDPLLRSGQDAEPVVAQRSKPEQIELLKTKNATRVAKPPPPGMQDVIAHYCEQWKSRYRSTKSPKIFGAAAGAISKMVTEMGAESAKEYITAYFQMPDQWFVTKSHDVPTLISNLNKVTHFMSTGKMITRTEIQNLDKNVSNNNTLMALERGEI